MCNIDFYRGQYHIWKVQIHSILKQTYDAIQEITEQINLEFSQVTDHWKRFSACNLRSFA